MRARSIPEEHEARVLRWFLEGDSSRTIADRLAEKHGVSTSPGSVNRLVERLTQGDCTNSVARAVMAIRLNAPKAAEKFLHHGAVANRIAGLAEPVEIPRGVTRKDIYFASRMAERELKVAGCLGRDADRAMQRLHEHSEQLCREEEEEAADATRGAAVRPIAEPPPEPSGATSIDHSSPAPDVPVPVALLEPIPLRVLTSGPKPFPAVAPPKLGRNEQCLCGSGMKFKRCCGGPNGRPRCMLSQPTNLQPLAGCPAVRRSNMLPSASGAR